MPFRIKFYEVQLQGIIGQHPVTTIYLNQNKTIMPVKNQTKIRYIYKCDEEIPIPAKGVIMIEMNLGTVRYPRHFYVTSFTYCIPHVTSNKSSNFKIVKHQNDDDGKISFIENIIPDPIFREVEESEFKEYIKLKDKCWVTLNPISEPIVIQLKLKKIKPQYLYYSVSRGEYWVYKITKIVINMTIIFEKPFDNRILVGNNYMVDKFIEQCDNQREKTI